RRTAKHPRPRRIEGSPAPRAGAAPRRRLPCVPVPEWRVERTERHLFRPGPGWFASCSRRSVGTISHAPERRSVMGWLWMIVIGLVAGAMAKLIMPGKDPGGTIVTILIGIAGSLVGGFLGRALGMGGGEGGGAGIIGSVIGALILLAGYRALARPGTRRV